MLFRSADFAGASGGQITVVRGETPESYPVDVSARFFRSLDGTPAAASELTLRVGDKVNFVLVSLDTERDTPAALHDYRGRQQLANANWTLLRGAKDDVRELAALLGVNYQKDARGQFAHSNVITILNPEGEIIHQQIGLNQKPGDAVKALQK